MIECSEINQTINELLTAFDDCKKIRNEDLVKLVQLIAAVNLCANGGVNYGTIINEIHEPIENQIIRYPVNSFHAISIVVVSGQVIYNGVTLVAGNSINLEVTTTNQTALEFLAKAGCKVLVETIIETV
jgi:hypothetical protein